MCLKERYIPTHDVVLKLTPILKKHTLSMTKYHEESDTCKRRDLHLRQRAKQNLFSSLTYMGYHVRKSFRGSETPRTLIDVQSPVHLQRQLTLFTNSATNLKRPV